LGRRNRRRTDPVHIFISSNPSIGDDNEAFGASSNDALWDSHHYAFGGGKRKYIIDGIFPANGGKLKRVAYWVAVKARASELIPHAVPGRDYVLTEVVHCKSKGEIGVRRAASTSWDLHSEPVLALSPAAVVIVVGQVAREFFLGIGAPIPPKIEERKLGGRIRLMAYLPHPAGFAKKKTLVGLLDPSDVDRLRLAAIAARSPHS
jgi:hypothetical protein